MGIDNIRYSFLHTPSSPFVFEPELLLGSFLRPRACLRTRNDSEQHTYDRYDYIYIIGLTFLDSNKDSKETARRVYVYRWLDAFAVFFKNNNRVTLAAKSLAAKVISLFVFAFPFEIILDLVYNTCIVFRCHS